MRSNARSPGGSPVKTDVNIYTVTGEIGDGVFIVFANTLAAC